MKYYVYNEMELLNLLTETYKNGIRYGVQLMAAPEVVPKEEIETHMIKEIKEILKGE